VSRTLILGGVRSGKTRLAQRLALASGLPVTYVATATAGDPEMARRIAEHQAQRPSGWTLVEEPIALARVLGAAAGAPGGSGAGPGTCVVVDCLTLWLTNLLLAPGDVLSRERVALLATLPVFSGELILVANETNSGVIPLGELSRRFCDEAGALHQDLARLCDRVILTVAGLPLVLKGAPL
jgi:adenosylcobinamide kinase/adenosylcobinamide-phosphate guanylyltransferase